MRTLFSPVYRENPLAGGQPRAVLEVDFDIVSPERTVAAEAEVLAVIEELLDDVPGLSSENWVFHLNHHVGTYRAIPRRSQMRMCHLLTFHILCRSSSMCSARSHPRTRAFQASG